MRKKLKAVFLFDISSVDNLQSIRSRILGDNRRFAVIWAAAQFLYGAFCMAMSFFQEHYLLCRRIYIEAMAVSLLAFLCAQFIAKKKPLTVYFAMLLDYLAILGSGILIARTLLQTDAMTIMLFASVLITPIFFVTNTLLNIITAAADVVAAVILLKPIPEKTYNWCVATLVIIASMGVVLGHFINKQRFERYVFSESAAKLAELQTRYAYYDRMTGLKNRRAYSEHVESFEKEMDPGCSVIMADINGLKRMNDAHGHVAGDELITGAADCLRRAFEGADAIYRIGGDEFCIVSSGAKEEIEACLGRLAEICAGWKGRYVDGISVSCGCASAKEFSCDIDSVLRAADERMYAAKSDYYKAAGLER